MTTLCVGDSHVKRLKRFVNTGEPASITYRISNLGNVHYYGISGGLFSNNNNLRLIADAVRHFKPRHIIVIFGENDLDSDDEHFHPVCTLTRLIAFLTQVRHKFHLDTVTCITFIPRHVCRHISVDKCNERVKEANKLLYELCAQSNIICWKLRGFYNSVENIYCDGVHLNTLGFYKLVRQIRGIFLTGGQYPHFDRKLEDRGF